MGYTNHNHQERAGGGGGVVVYQYTRKNVPKIPKCSPIYPKLKGA